MNKLDLLKLDLNFFLVWLNGYRTERLFDNKNRLPYPMPARFLVAEQYYEDGPSYKWFDTESELVKHIENLEEDPEWGADYVEDYRVIDMQTRTQIEPIVKRVKSVTVTLPKR